jgi:4-alpha-glucanotransferase
MNFERSSGVLLHPTSLSGPFGIGDIGPEAYRWIDFLADVGCRLWQILPLGPTGYGDSPYQCFSAFAGNPYLVSPEAMFEAGLLDSEDLLALPDFPKDRVDFGTVIPWKLRILDRAFTRFQEAKSHGIIFDEFEVFRQNHAHWLSDFALFMAIKEAYGGGAWVNWPKSLRNRAPAAIEKARKIHSELILRQEFRQFLFFHQWEALKAYANSRGVMIIGDVPIFVAHDSAEVWAQPHLFYLNNLGKPTVVAGVPPDYFSKTGQLWGNPLYRWDEHAQNGFAWWLSRLRAVLNLVDIVRLDHFRGFAGYWEVSARAKTAVKGRWVPGPGQAFFQAVANNLGELPIIAEDLGVITPDVVEIRDRFNLPGMKIIQFSFHGDPEEPFLPHNHIENCVLYTGTHDNDTSCGWYARINEKERDFYRRYLGRDGHDVAWDFIRACWSSVAVFALAPMQDLLNLGNEARMNYPGNPSGNWSWRMPDDALSESVRNRLMEFNYLYSRSTQQKTNQL